MPGLGTLINTLAIAVAGVLGLMLRRVLHQRYQESIITASGVAVAFLGAAGSLAKMLQMSPDGAGLEVHGALLMILSLILGALTGEIIDIDRGFTRFGVWLKRKSGSSKDPRFVDAFVTASLTVCVGAMAIIGAIEDGLRGDISVLAAKSLLDFFIILMIAASMGRGAGFAALPVLLLQGSVTILAKLVEPIMTDTVIGNISLVGNVLIACVGLNLVRPRTVNVANLLPALLFAIGFSFVPALA